MKPVAAGQWTDLGKDHLIEYEISRADRIEVRFRQDAVALTSDVTGRDKVHVQVPGRLKPGKVEVRTRTWIEQTASEWSEPASFQVLERPVSPSIIVIAGGPIGRLVWSAGAPESIIQTAPGETLLLRGHFPVRNAAGLRVQLRGARRTLQLTATDVDGGVSVLIPSRAAPGEWRIVVSARSGNTTPQEIATVRIAGPADLPVR